MDKAKILRLCNEINDKIVEFWNCEQIEHDDAQHIISLLDLIGFEVSAKHKTNADRIRQMTDEELAEELTSLIINALHSRAIFYGKATEKQITVANMKWLKQEVSEDAGTD